MNKNDIKEYANHLMFDLNDEELSAIEKDFAVLEAQLGLLDLIDTTNTEEMIYPFEDDTFFLREDNADHIISKEDALRNAPKEREGHFVVPKVVK